MAETPATNSNAKKIDDREDDDIVLRRRRISPYDLSPSDNPGMLLTHVVLRGDNYEEWSKSLRLALRARKKFGFVDRSIPQPPPDSDDLDDWWTNHSLLVSWIRNTIEPSLRSSISLGELSSDLWDEIKTRFSVVNGPRIQQLKRELSECKQKGLTMEAYYGKMKKLWDDLDDVDKFPDCVCANCTASLAAALLKKEDEHAHQFLMGLDEALYGSLRTQLLSQDPLPTVLRIYNVLVQAETARNASRSMTGDTEASAFVMRTNTKKDVICTNCKKPGHDVDTCYKLHGYPEGWIFGRGRGGQNSSGGRGTGRGTGRGGRGGGAGSSAPPAGGSNGTSIGQAAVHAVHGAGHLTPEQWDTVRHALSLSPTGSTEKLTGPKFGDIDWCG